MASNEDLRNVAGKALADHDFRQKLLADPEAALKAAGIELSDEQLNALKEMDTAQLEQGLTDLDKRLTMGCWGKYQNPLRPEVCSWD